MKLRLVPLVLLLRLGLGGLFAQNQTFPVKIQHKFGEITIPQKPARIVSIGFSDQDFILALDEVPIAIRDWYGDQPYATWPWAQAKLGQAKPVVLPSGDLDIEKIASLKPDLIVGISSGMSEKVYKLLSKIAPTLAQSGQYKDFGSPWQESTRAIAKALGKSARAEAIIKSIEDRFKAESSHKFKGRTAAVAFYWQKMPGAYASQDGRSRFLIDLGFAVPPVFDRLAGSNFYVSFSEEKLDLLNLDLVVWISSTNEGIEEIKSLALRQKLKFAVEGREVFLGKTLGGAFSFGSPLSLNYLLDQLVPAFHSAIDGNPNTRVELKE